MFLDQTRSHQGSDHDFFPSRDIVDFSFLLWLDWIEKWKYIEARQDQIEAKAKDQAQQY